MTFQAHIKLCYLATANNKKLGSLKTKITSVSNNKNIPEADDDEPVINTCSGVIGFFKYLHCTPKLASHKNHPASQQACYMYSMQFLDLSYNFVVFVHLISAYS